jgi:uncharacterized phage infection (PIP) family protein YhgE
MKFQQTRLIAIAACKMLGLKSGVIGGKLPLQHSLPAGISFFSHFHPIIPLT